MQLNKFTYVINDIEVGFANITFAYDNPELLNLLATRGSAVTSGKFDKLPAINEKLQELKDTKKNKLIRPVAAFLTFNTQEGYERALKYWGPNSEKNGFSELTEAHKFCDTVIKVKPAPEPSNIIWENRHFTRKKKLRNKIIVAFVILCLLGLAFALFTYAKMKVSDIQERYPPTFDCTDI